MLSACCCRIIQIKESPEQFCSTEGSNGLFRPNYNNPDIQSAYNILRKRIPRKSFYTDPETIKYLPEDTDRSDMFLSSLCLQYSDNQEFLISKIKLIKKSLIEKKSVLVKIIIRGFIDIEPTGEV